MPKKNRGNIYFPKEFMKTMKKKKGKKIRNTPINEKIIEQKFNDAKHIL